MTAQVVEYAKQLSHKLHAGMFRKDGKTPYTVHTDYVGDNVAKYLPHAPDSTLAIAQAVGYGHDLVEDVVYPETLLKFGLEAGMPVELWTEIVNRVVILSRMSKEEPILEYLNRISEDEVCIAVKLVDLEHNMSDLNPSNLRDKYELCKEYLQRRKDILHQKLT